MRIGPYRLSNNIILAPMAGVTDRPFRQLCKNLGAGMAVSEMVSSNSLLWGSKKTQLRINHKGETEPRSVQIAGADPELIAEAAISNGLDSSKVVALDEVEQVIKFLRPILQSDDVVLVKGSNLMRMDRIVSALEVQS